MNCLSCETSMSIASAHKASNVECNGKQKQTPEPNTNTQEASIISDPSSQLSQTLNHSIALVSACGGIYAVAGPMFFSRYCLHSSAPNDEDTEPSTNPFQSAVGVT